MKSFLTIIALLLGVHANGAPRYNCKPDRKLDAPMQFNAVVESAGRLHLSAYGGSDKSGFVQPSASGTGSWRIYSSGTQLSQFASGLVVFVSTNMFKEVNVEGLTPGQTYEVELNSSDLCGNLGSVRKTVTMPAAVPETTTPNVSNLSLVLIGLLWSYENSLHFAATDDTGISNISILFNGVLMQEYNYFNGTFRWWTDPYNLDDTQSTLEGPNFFYYYPRTFVGQSVLVQVVATDIHGNQTVQSSQMTL